MSKKLTPWFDDFSNPARPGWYDTKWLVFNEPSRREFGKDGYWLDEGGNPSSLQCFYWRGLAKKPATKDAEVSNG